MPSLREETSKETSIYDAVLQESGEHRGNQAGVRVCWGVGDRESEGFLGEGNMWTDKAIGEKGGTGMKNLASAILDSACYPQAGRRSGWDMGFGES